jgi:hypothetical protein
MKGGMMSNEDREAKGAQWLQRLQEAAVLKESLVEYCRRRGYRPGEAYQWKRNLISSGRWPTAKAGGSTVVETAAPEGFARVRIVPEHPRVSAPLHLQLHLANGRRAELLLSDERQLPRVLALLEEPL